MVLNWLRALKRRPVSPRWPQTGRPQFLRPRVEELEDRITPGAHTWSGGAGAGSPQWSNAANWSAGGAVASNETNVQITFAAGIGQTTSTNDLTGISLQSISFASGTSTSYTVNLNATGQQVQTGGLTITNSNSAAQTISGTQALNLADVLTATTSAGMVTINTALSGTNGVTTTGTGTVVLGGNNSFSGPVAINAGTLEVTVNNALGNGTGTTTVAGGATLQIQGVNYTTAQPVTLAPGGTMLTPFGGPPPSTFAGTITNQGTAANPGIIDSGANSPLTLTGGIVCTDPNAGLNLNASGSGLLTINTNGISDSAGTVAINVLSGGVRLTEANNFTGTTTVSVNSVIFATVDGALGATGAANPLVLTGPGVASLIFDGGVNYASPKVINCVMGPGNIQAQNGNTTFAGTINDNTGTGIDITSSTVGDLFTLTGPINMNGNIVRTDGGGDMLFTTSLVGPSLGVGINGTGVVTFAGNNNNYAGGTNDNGFLRVTGNVTASNINMPVGTTLEGTGQVFGLSIFGTLLPGDVGTAVVGTLTATGMTSFNNQGTFLVRLDGTGSGSSDLLNQTSGTVTFNNATLAVTQLVPTTTNQVFTILSSPGGHISLASTFNGLPNNGTFVNGGRVYRVNYSVNAVTLTDITGEATTLHWIGSAAANGNLWSVAANWLENQVPVSGNTLVFDTTTAGFSATVNGFAPINDLSGLINVALVINDNSAAGDFTLSGNGIGLATAGVISTVSTGTAATVALPLTLPAAPTAFNVNAGLPLVLSAALGGTGTLSEVGAGPLTLTGNSGSGFTGITAVFAGTLTVNGTIAASQIDINNAAATVGGGGTVQYIVATTGTLKPGLGVGTATLTAGGGADSTFNGATFAVDINGSAGDQLNQTANRVNITGSSLVVNTIASGAIGQAYTIINSPGGVIGTFTNAPVSGITYSLGGVFYTVTYNAASVVLTRANAPTTLHWLGSTAANGKQWNVAANWLENTVPVSGDTLVFDTTTANFSATANGFAPTNNIVGLASISLTINDTSAAGDFTITGNQLSLAAGGITSTVSTGASATVNFAGTGITLAAAATLTSTAAPLIVSGPVATAGFALSVAGAGNTNLSGVISGTGSLVENSSSTLTLTAANTYSGGTILTAGTLALGRSSGAGNGPVGTGTLTINGGSVQTSGAAQTITNGFTVGGAGTLAGTLGLTLNGIGTLNSTLTVTNSGPTTFGGALSGGAGLTVNTGGLANTVTLGGNAANTFTGTTAVQSGTLRLNKPAGTDAVAGTLTISAGAAVTYLASNEINDGAAVTDQGTLTVSGFTDTIGLLSSPAGGTVDLTAVGSALTVGANNTSSTYAGTFTGAGSLTKVGTGTLTLSGSSGAGFTGITTLQAGALEIDGMNSASPVTVTGGTLQGIGTVRTITATGGTVSPGAGGTGTTGTLTTAAGALGSSLNGSVFQVDVNNPAAADQLAIGNSAAVTLTGCTLSINVLGSAAGNVYTLVSSVSGAINGTFTGLANGVDFQAGGRTFRIAYTTTAVTLTDVVPTALAFGQQPTNAAFNTAITPAPTVKVLDQFGAVLQSDNGRSITVAIGTNPGGGTLSGTLSVNDINGVATFVDLSINQPGAGYTLTAGSGTLSGATSNAFSILPGPPVRFTVTGAGVTTVGAAVVVTVTGFDSAGHLTTNYTGSVRFVSTDPGAALPPPYAFTAGDAGNHTFSVVFATAGSQVVTVLDSVQGSVSGSLAVLVNAPAALPSSTPFPAVAVGVAYNRPVPITGGTGPFTFAVVDGALPPGLSLAANGILSGTPTLTGTYQFTIQVTDALGVSTSQTITFTVNLRSSQVPIIATGTNTGGAPLVNVYNAASDVLLTSFDALPPGFAGGVRVAVGDVNGDGVPDIMTAAGPGGGPEVRVFDGRTFQPLAGPLGGFYALPSQFTGGVFLAAGDVNGDGYADIICAADAGGGPQVTITSGKDGSMIASFYATASTFTGGIRVAVGDINGDGRADVIAAAGPGGGPQVTIFDGKSLSLLTAFYALPSTFMGGMFIAVGDVTGDGRADLIVGAEKGGGPEVSLFNGPDQKGLGAFYALTPSFTGGVRVATVDTTGSGHDSILTAAGPGGGPQVAVFDGLSLQLLTSFFAYAPGFTGGVFVSAG